MKCQWQLVFPREGDYVTGILTMFTEPVNVRPRSFGWDWGRGLGWHQWCFLSWSDSSRKWRSWGWRADRRGSQEERENKSPGRMSGLNEIAGREGTQVRKGFSFPFPTSQREGESTNIKILGSFCIWGNLGVCKQTLNTDAPCDLSVCPQRAEAFYNWTSFHGGYSSCYLNSSIWKAEKGRLLVKIY